MAAVIGVRRSSASRLRLGRERVEALRRVREKSGKGYAELARKFKVSSDVVRFALGK